MRKYEILTVNKSRLILFLFYLLPLIDVLNGILVRRIGFYGAGSVGHLIILICLFIFIYGREAKIGFFEKISLSLTCTFMISIFTNCILTGMPEAITLERIGKILCCVYLIAIINRMVTSSILSEKQFYILINYQCVVVSLCSLLGNLTGIGNFTYSSAQTGRIGFYTGTNEPVAIFTILACISLRQLLKQFHLKTFILFLCLELCLLFVQSKMSYFMFSALAFVLVSFYVVRIIKRHRIKVKYLLILCPVLYGCILFAKKIFSKTIENFLSRQTYQYNHFESSGLLAYLSSGRTTRFTSLLLPMFEGKPFEIFCSILFGRGANLTYGQTFEMDYLDVFLYGGIIAFIIFVLLTYRIIQLIIKRNRSFLDIIQICLVLVFSFFAGHVWVGGVSGIYFALMAGFYMNFNLDKQAGG